MMRTRLWLRQSARYFRRLARRWRGLSPDCLIWATFFILALGRPEGWAFSTPRSALRLLVWHRIWSRVLSRGATKPVTGPLRLQKTMPRPALAILKHEVFRLTTCWWVSRPQD